MSTCYQSTVPVNPPLSYTGGDRKKRRPPNAGSKLLERQENEMLFSIIGPDNISLTAAVVELLFVESRRWKLQFRGVISLVKDYQNRAYFLRVYDILSGQKLWDFRLYRGFQAVSYGNCPFLLTFEDESRRNVYGLNFSSVEEARDFKGHLDKRHEQEGKSFPAKECSSLLPSAMWMVVTEDPLGRIHFEYRDLPSSQRKWFDRPSRSELCSRGCAPFPNPARLSAYYPSSLPAKKYEYERYDNVTPEPQYFSPYQLFYEPIQLMPGSLLSSSMSSSSPYRTPGISVPATGRSVYYYHSQDNDSQLSDDFAATEHGLVSCGEYVASFVQGSQGDYSDLDFENIPSTMASRNSLSHSATNCQHSYANLRQQQPSVDFEDPTDSAIVSSSVCSKRNSCSSYSSSKNLLPDLRFSWRRKLSAAAKNPLSHSANPPYALSSSNIGNTLPTTHVPVSGGVTPVGTMVHAEKFSTTTTPTSFFSRKDKKKKGKRPRIRKEDISNPTNFQHKAHVGWDQDNGFSNNMCDSEPMDESIKNIIRAAGQDPTNMNKKTIKFVYDFIENYKDEEQSTQSYKAAAHLTPQWSSPVPPPPPNRTASHQSSTPPARPPPPPPSVTSSRPFGRPLPQVPNNDLSRPAAVPPPPPPPAFSSSAPPPPPPPPPPSLNAISLSSGPAPPPPPPPPTATLDSGRGNLLAEIQAGKQLRSVGSQNAEKPNNKVDARDNVMAQIRQGAQLKHVDTTAEQEKRRSESTLPEIGGLAGALARALEERRMNMALDDSSEEEESDEKNDDWSD